MESRSSVVDGLKPSMLMMMVQVAAAGLNVVYKLAATDGMSLRIMVAYRFLFAAAFMLPLAFFVERKKRPKLTWVVVGQSFVYAFLGGSLCQNLYAKSLVMTSTTFASAMTNLIPIFTFVIAVSLRMETLKLGTMEGKAKVMGTLISIGGAMLLMLYKGAEIDIWSTHFNLSHDQHTSFSSHTQESSTSTSSNPVMGSFLAISASLSSALSTIVQAKLSKAYPCHYSSTALVAVMGSFQAVAFALSTERDWNQWKLGLDIRLVSVAYSGIVVSGITVICVMWCIRMTGPLFVSVFNPLAVVLTAIAGSMVLDEKLHLGSVVGAVLIICGLYVVLWGKGKEMAAGAASSSSSMIMMPAKDNEKSFKIEINDSSFEEDDDNHDNNNEDDDDDDIIIITSSCSLCVKFDDLFSAHSKENDCECIRTKTEK